MEVCQTVKLEEKTIGSYRGFTMMLAFDPFNRSYRLALHRNQAHRLWLGNDVFGNIQRIDNEIGSLPEEAEGYRKSLAEAERQLEVARVEVDKPFPQEDELRQKTERLNELNAMLNLDQKDNEIVDEGESSQNTESAAEAEQRCDISCASPQDEEEELE